MGLRDDIKAFLLAQEPLHALVGTRIFETIKIQSFYHPLPIANNPHTGPAVHFQVRGGPPNTTSLYVRPTVYVRCYGKDEGECESLDMVLKNVLDGASFAKVRRANMQTSGQIDSDPETDWLYAFSLYELFVVP